MNLKSIWTGCVLLLISVPLLAQKVDIYPPNWWAGMKRDQLQLLVYGKDISEYKLNIQSHNIRLDGVTALPNEDFMAIDLNIAGLTEPEKLKMTFFSSNDRFVLYYEFKGRRFGSAKRWGVTPQDIIYSIQVDRFANGDPANDVVAGFNDSIIDRGNPNARHGGDLQGIANQFPYLGELGVTALQLSPVLENNVPEGSFHGNPGTAHYKTDPRFCEDRGAFKSFVEQCHDQNFKVLMEFNYNHMAANHWLIRNLPYGQWVNPIDSFGATNHWVTAPLDRYATKAHKGKLVEGWLGKDYTDLNFDTEYIRNFLIQNTIWWMEFADIDGIKIADVPYVQLEYINAVANALEKEYPKMLKYGDIALKEPVQMAYYVKSNFNGSGEEVDKATLPNVTDHPVYTGIVNSLAHGNPFPLFQTLSSDYVYHSPGRHVLYPDHPAHWRFADHGSELVPRFKMAMGLLLTLNRIPQVQYGTELLLTSQQEGKHYFVDFPYGVGGEGTFNFEKLSPQQQEAYAYFKALAQYRKNSVVLQEGGFAHFPPVGGVYVYFRFREEGTVLVLFNPGDQASTVAASNFPVYTEGFQSGTDVYTGKPVGNMENINVDKHSIKIIELRK